MALLLLILTLALPQPPVSADAEPTDAGPRAAWPTCPPFPEVGRPPWEAKDPELPAFEPPTLPEPEPKLPKRPLAEVSRGSTSLATANGGSLRRSVALPEVGRHHRVLPGKADKRYGTKELVRAIERASRAVARKDRGAKLAVGNMSKEGGGRLRVSASHQSGRDVDLAFYVVDGRTKRSVQPDGYTHFDEDGRATKGRLRFDVARNWTLVEALVTDPGGVQWIFVYRPLRKLLLEYGLAHGASPEVLARAAQVLHQPMDSRSHDDHFHVRLHCSPDDLLDGCRDYGPRRWWAPLPRHALAERTTRLREVLDDETAPLRHRMKALALLDELRAEDAGPSFSAALDAKPLKLRLAAQTALAHLGSERWAAAVAESLEPGAALALIEGGLDALQRLSEPAVWPALLRLTEDLRLRPRRRRRRGPKTIAGRALAVLRALSPPDAVPGLIEVLRDPKRRKLVGAVNATLERIACRARPRSKAPEAAAEEWSRWWSEQGARPRSEWLVAGLGEAGYPLPQGPCTVRNMHTLIPALGSKQDWVRSNASDLMRAIVNMRPWRPGKKRLSARFWRRWWKRIGRRASERVDPPVAEAPGTTGVPAPAVP